MFTAIILSLIIGLFYNNYVVDLHILDVLEHYFLVQNLVPTAQNTLIYFQASLFSPASASPLSPFFRSFSTAAGLSVLTSLTTI